MYVRPDKKLRIAKRRQQVAVLYLQGNTQVAIAREVGAQQPTISNDIKAIQKEWRESAIRDFDLLREEELQKLAQIEVEAWAAWVRSQKPAQEARVRDSDPSNAVKTMKSRTGDPRFLEIVMKCSASRRELLGLDAPVKVAPTTPDGEQPYHAYVIAELMRISEKATSGPEIIDGAVIEQASDPLMVSHGKTGCDVVLSDGQSPCIREGTP